MKAGRRSWLAFLFAYVVAVLVVDTLATRQIEWIIDWRMFEWRDSHVLRWDTGAAHAPGADWFKLIAWLVIPLVLCIRGFDRQWFTFTRWKRIDVYLTIAALVAGGLVIAAIPFIPGVRDMYRGAGAIPGDVRVDYALHYLTWIATWFFGWELMHRYMLLRQFEGLPPAVAWGLGVGLIPIIEAAYHLAQGKELLECAGVWVFGVLACAWALSRRNALLPIIAHGFIEVALLVFLMVM